MSKDKLLKIISDCCNDVLFTYKGKASGVTSTVNNYRKTFQVWHGNDVKEYDDVDDVMNDKFYSGKSLAELISVVDFTFA